MLSIDIIETCSFACKVATPKKYDFRNTSKLGQLCSVFMEANSFGIDICLSFDLSVTWIEESEFLVESKDLSVLEYVWTSEYKTLIGVPSNFWCSKIPGVFQLDPGLIYKTDKNTKILLQGAMNSHSESYWVHTGILDSDWFHIPSTINIQFKKQGQKINFKKGDAIARLIPIGGYDALAKIDFEVSNIDDWPDSLAFWRNYISDTFKSTGKRPQRVKYGMYKELKERVENGVG